MQLDKILIKLGLSSAMAELAMFVFVMLAISLVYWLLINRFRLHNMLINIYVTYAVLSVLPQEIVGLVPYAKLYFFLIFLVLMFFLSRFIFEIHLSGPGLVYWQAIFMSFLQVGLMMSIIFSLLPKQEVSKYVTGEALFYFISDWSIAIWMLLPLVFLTMINRRGR